MPFAGMIVRQVRLGGRRGSFCQGNCPAEPNLGEPRCSMRNVATMFREVGRNATRATATCSDRMGGTGGRRGSFCQGRCPGTNPSIVLVACVWSKLPMLAHLTGTPCRTTTCTSPSRLQGQATTCCNDGRPREGARWCDPIPRRSVCAPILRAAVRNGLGRRG